jgi:hypothetical protein
MQQAKLGLSEEERRLVSDPGLILTKNAIIAKVYDLFGELAGMQQSLPFPEEVRVAMPKISRGENYHGLPYVVLDFPRLFTADHVLAIRTHFWWGHYFSVTLHLKGMYRERYAGRCLDAYAELSEQGYLMASTGDEWEHRVSEPWYRPVASMDRRAFGQALHLQPFLKIGKTLPLDGDGLYHPFRFFATLIA